MPERGTSLVCDVLVFPVHGDILWQLDRKPVHLFSILTMKKILILLFIILATLFAADRIGMYLFNGSFFANPKRRERRIREFSAAKEKARS